jgi:hypothetical protein
MENPNKKQLISEIPNIKTAKSKIKSGKFKELKKCFFVFPDYCLDFVVLMFGFPIFFRKSGKSKQKIVKIQTNNLFLYFLDFADFILDFAVFIFGLSKQFKI